MRFTKEQRKKIHSIAILWLLMAQVRFREKSLEMEEQIYAIWHGIGLI